MWHKSAKSNQNNSFIEQDNNVTYLRHKIKRFHKQK